MRNINGNVTVVTGSGFHVRARKIADRSDPNDVAILVRPSPTGAVVCVRYPGDSRASCDNDGMHAHEAHDNDTHVDFTITVPAGVDLRAATVNGNVDAHVAGDASGTTVNGNVTLDAHDVSTATTEARSRGSARCNVRSTALARARKPSSVRARVASRSTRSTARSPSRA